MRKAWVSLLSALLVSSSIVAFPASANPKGIPNANAVGFWNADRINNAIAFDMVFEPGAKSAKRVPVAKSSGKSTSGSTSSVLGSSWNKGGLPLTATGKVFFSVGTSYYQCSGALVKDGNPNQAIVLTAGHCVYDNASSRYVENWIFIPSYDVNQVTISGCANSNKCWPASIVVAHIGFTSETSFTTAATRYDWGFARILPKNGSLPDLDESNSFPVSFNSLTKNTLVNSFGYPAAGKYNGNDLIYSSGQISFDSRNNSQTYGLASDMTGGCSGGPWLSSLQNNNPYNGILSSVNSYKYGTTTYIYGPIFNSETESTYRTANS